MKSKLIAILLFFTGFNAMAQLHPVPISYRSGFYNYNFVNPDSALFYAQKLANNSEYAGYLRQALHADFLFSFMENHEALPICYNTLTKLYTDSDLTLVKSAEPLYLWVEVQRNSTDLEKIERLTITFISSLLQQKDLYQNKAATYGLLIYKILEREKKLDKLSDELLKVLIDKLEGEQLEINVNRLSNSLHEKRAWYRYVYATANYYKAEKLAKTGDNKKAASYFKTASEISPDLTDLMQRNEYFNEEFIFANRQKNLYHKEYLKFLKTSGANKNEVLSALCNMAFRDPIEFKDSLKIFYTENFIPGESFEKFWAKEINSKLLKAPDFIANTLDGKSYSSLKTGKWTLIYFWGTWCGYCREEHPKLQKFYASIQSDFVGKLELLTIACKDTEPDVNSYMKEFKYSFPVAMENGAITKLFNIHGYPTMALISPEGNYTLVPNAIDWINFVKHYISL